MSVPRSRAAWSGCVVFLVTLLALPAWRAEAQTQPSFVRKWAALVDPTGITVDIDEPTKPGGGAPAGTAGNVYVADTGNNRVAKFSGTGVFITAWGTLGSGLGQFNGPTGIEVKSTGLVYVADTNNNRIQRFNSTGGAPFAFGSAGAGNGQFNLPQGVAVDGVGNIFVADTGNNRVQRFNSSGVFVLAWGSLGSAPGQFNGPKGIAVDRFGNVFVADTGNNRVQSFTPTGGPLSIWGTSGSSAGQFSGPCGITVDIDEPTKPGGPTTAVVNPGAPAGGNVYVADTGNHRIQKFTSNGTFITQWGTFGALDGQFNSPKDVAVNKTREVYIADTNNNRVQEFTFEILGIPVVTPWTLALLLVSLATAGFWWFGRRLQPVTVRRDR